MTMNMHTKIELTAINTQSNSYELDFDEDEMLLDELQVFQQQPCPFPKLDRLHFQQSQSIDHSQNLPLFNNLFKFTEDEESQDSIINTNQQINDTQSQPVHNQAFIYKDLILKLQLALQKILTVKKDTYRVHSEVSLQKQDQKRKLSDLQEVAEENLYSNQQPKSKNRYMVASTNIRNKTNCETVCQRSAINSERTKPKDIDRKHLNKTDSCFPQQINELTDRKSQLQRKTKEFLDNMVIWQEKKDKKNQERILKEKEIFKTQATFVPTINLKSKILMKKKGETLPIFERLLRSKKTDNNQQQTHKK